MRHVTEFSTSYPCIIKTRLQWYYTDFKVMELGFNNLKLKTKAEMI